MSPPPGVLSRSALQHRRSRKSSLQGVHDPIDTPPYSPIANLVEKAEQEAGDEQGVTKKPEHRAQDSQQREPEASEEAEHQTAEDVLGL